MNSRAAAVTGGVLALACGFLAGTFIGSGGEEKSVQENGKKLLTVSRTLIEEDLADTEKELHETIAHIGDALKNDRDFVLAFFVEKKKTAQTVRKKAGEYGRLFPRLAYLRFHDSEGIPLSRYGTKPLPADSSVDTQQSPYLNSEYSGIVFTAETHLKERGGALQVHGGRLLPLERLRKIARLCGNELVIIQEKGNDGDLRYVPLYSSFAADIERFGIDPEKERVIINSSLYPFETLSLGGKMTVYIIGEAEKREKEKES
ncbi:MAG: hypothetical protein ACQEQV_10485 [Fibrobacterota bacterium]